MLRYESKTDTEIAYDTKYNRKWVSRLCAEFKSVGLLQYTKRKYGGNNTNMSREEEVAFVESFNKQAELGELVTMAAIAAAYDEKTGKSRESKSTVYKLLHRHKWRKLKPRRQHPKKASEAEMDASKKLTNATTN